MSAPERRGTRSPANNDPFWGRRIIDDDKGLRRAFWDELSPEEKARELRIRWRQNRDRLAGVR